MNRSAFLPSAASLPGEFSTPKNSSIVGTPFFTGNRRDVPGRLDAQHRNPASDEVLEQVAVVAGGLHDQAVLPEVSACSACSAALAAACLQHGVGEAGEVQVVAEQDLRRHRLGDLEQRAFRADDQVQRVRRLRFAQAESGVGRRLARGVLPRSRTDTGSAAPQQRQANGVTRGPPRDRPRTTLPTSSARPARSCPADHPSIFRALA